MKMKYSLITILTAVMAVSVSAQVKDFGKREGFTLGLGSVSDWAPYEGALAPTTSTIPYIAYDWENAHLGVDGFSYDFLDYNNLELSVLFEPRWTFADPEDSPLFADIERDTALEVGISANYDFGLFEVAVTGLRDVSSVHDGFEGSIEVTVSTSLGGLLIEPGIGYVYRDEKLGLHLYGVNTDEARVGLSAFTPRASLVPYATTNLIWPVGGSMAFLVFARYEHLPSRVTNSPLVQKDRDANVGIAFLKQF